MQAPEEHSIAVSSPSNVTDDATLPLNDKIRGNCAIVPIGQKNEKKSTEAQLIFIRKQVSS